MNPTTPILFDRALLRKRLEHAAQNFVSHNFLHREAAHRLADSLDAITYQFPNMVELCAHTGALASLLKTRPGTQAYIQCDSAAAMLQQCHGIRVQMDEEWLPFGENTLDAVVSAWGLQFINDMPGVFAQIQRALKPDGLFMAVMPGPDTLRELRQIFAETEATRSDGITPRIAPFLDVRDAGGLLQRAGFALPVVDRDFLTVSYENMFGLMHDLRGSAQSNLLQQRLQHFTPRGFFLDAAQRYHDRFGDAEGRIPATFEFITLTAWKPAATQQQPARRGSGQVSLKDALN